MKIAINAQFGGFSLSPAAMREYYGRKGKQVYFFKYEYPANSWDWHEGKYILLENPEAEKGWWSAYSTPDAAEDTDLDSRPHDKDRADPDLIATIEKLGSAASGPNADIQIVDIPDDVEWYIEEYDGAEHVAEVHRTWYAPYKADLRDIIEAGKSDKLD